MKKNPTELKQSICFKDVLSYKWKSGNVLHRGSGYAFVSAENKKLNIPSILINISFNWGRAPENPGFISEGRNQEEQKNR